MALIRIDTVVEWGARTQTLPMPLSQTRRRVATVAVLLGLVVAAFEGTVVTTAMPIVSDIYDLEERAKIQGVFTGAWGAASVLGPVIGGWLVTHWSWRWVFFVNVPVGLLGVIVLLVSYRDRPVVHGPIGTRG